MKYHDCEGNEISLAKLVRIEPVWAANRIDFMNKQAPQIQAKIAELEKANTMLESIIIDQGKTLHLYHKGETFASLAIRDLEQQAKTADKILEVVSQYSQARRMRTAVEKIQAEIYHKAKALKGKG